jgi:intracellular sulfur oxidation DsrE/DsrF family protein
LDFVVKDKSAKQEAIQKIIAGEKATFKGCAMTMKGNNILPDQILPGVGRVPDGIFELITKQQEGWGYIKVAH